MRRRLIDQEGDDLLRGPGVLPIEAGEHFKPFTVVLVVMLQLVCAGLELLGELFIPGRGGEHDG